MVGPDTQSKPEITKTSKKSTAKTKPVDLGVRKLFNPGEFVLPVIPIREGVLFPNTESVLTFGRKSSISAIAQAKHTGNRVILVSQKNPHTEKPKPEDLYTVGTLAMVERTLNADGQINALVRGIGRVSIIEFVTLTPYLTAKIKEEPAIVVDDEETKALLAHLQKTFRKVVNLGKPVEFLNFMKLMSGADDHELADQVASTLSIETEEKQHILETFEVKKRLKIVIDHLTKEQKVLEIEKDVASKTQEKFEKHMRENVLRERLKTIQKELGELDEDEEIVNEYFTKLKRLKVSEVVKEKIAREIKRMQQMSVNNPESGYIRTWLDTVFELPWGKKSKDVVDIVKSAAVLEKHHHGLKDVKDRILEYIAVLQLKHDRKNLKATAITVPTILCFVGPPGVGKTSIGKSIAESLGRKFVKISLGGIRDEAEIRGHRRTYVGAMTGRIIAGMKQAGTMNPVFMLDEVDKLGADFRGDPSAALLETLDPEQNGTFEDHYLDIPYDLSQVIFITTANTLDTIPRALRDRLEIIRYSGYTTEEKFHIAKKYLLKKQLETNGLKPTQVQMSDEILDFIISRYTREAGVRTLERTIGKVLRKAVRFLLENKQKSLKLTPDLVREYLGPEPYDTTLTEKTDQIGLVTGLAWTEVGGDVLFVEVALSPGKGTIKLTGQLGDVMKESAQAAFTYVKSHAAEIGIPQKTLDKTDVHIHVPEGAVPKDGPSAGVTIATAIVSALTKKPVKRLTAMTGEVTLRGRVLRIGGLKEKSIAAHRAGSTTVLIPKDNERDLVEIPDVVKKAITFIPVATMEEVLSHAL